MLAGTANTTTSAGRTDFLFNSVPPVRLYDVAMDEVVKNRSRAGKQAATCLWV